MKVAYISTAFFADCDLPLLRQLWASGVEVSYFLIMSPSTQQASVVNVKYLQPQGGLFSANEYPELQFMADYLPLSHIYVVNHPKAHDWSPSTIKANFKLLRVLRENEFDIIHLTAPLRYSAFMLYALKSRMVLTMHDPIPHSSDMGLKNRFHRRIAFACVNHFIVLSQSLRNEFVQKYHLQNKRVYVSRLGIYDILHHVKPSSIQLPLDYLLFVGSINPHKGIRFLCEAMRKLHSRYPNLHLIIAGRGTFDFDVDEYVSQYPLTVINRFISDSELVSLIKGAKMVVCPYIDATQSGVLMSAFALNVPVVATRVGALHEMLTDGVHGLLAEPSNVDSLADAIQKMLQGDTLQQMSDAIHKDFIQGKRSWVEIADETLAVYHQIVSK